MKKWKAYRHISLRLFLLPEVLLFVVLSFFSCSPYFIHEEIIQQTNSMRQAIIDSFPKLLTVHISPLKNLSRDAEIDYISTGAEDILESYMKPMESEQAFYPYYLNSFKVSDSINSLIQATNNVFSNFVTNMNLVLTQNQYSFYTNTNYSEIVVTNFSGPTNLKNRKWTLSVTTNTNISIFSNIISFTTNATNIITFETNRYHDLIDEAFPDITNKLSYLNMAIIKEKSTNEISISNTDKPFNSYITGSYQVIPKLYGPKDIEFHFLVTSVYPDQIVSFPLNITCREDEISDRLYSLLKDIRRHYLNRPTGDVLLNSIPDEANIYLDNTFIGKAPYYYPSVPAGKHVITLQKEGYSQVSLEVTILTNITNRIEKKIIRLQTGGVLNVNSEPTNANVFLDSVFRGVTPLSLSNLTIGKEHRIKIAAFYTNLPPVYKNFTLRNSNETINYDIPLPVHSGSPEWEKHLSWWLAYAGWGTTIGYTIANIYCDYQMNHYLDLYNANLQPRDLQLANFYTDWNQRTFGGIWISGLISLFLTQNALQTESIYLGWENGPRNNPRLTVQYRF